MANERLPKASDFPPGTEFVIKEFDVPLANVPGEGWVNWWGGSPSPYDVKMLKVDNNWPADSFEQWVKIVEDNLLLYSCWTKATKWESGSPRATWRRRWFKVFHDRVECGYDWKVPFDSIRRAVVYRSRSLFLPVRVLHLEAKSGTYQLRFNPWVKIELHLPFKFESQDVLPLPLKLDKR
jgi:hypothetical protein